MFKWKENSFHFSVCSEFSLCLVPNGVLGRSTFLEMVRVGIPRFYDMDGEKNPGQEAHKGPSSMMETFGTEVMTCWGLLFLVPLILHMCHALQHTAWIIVLMHSITLSFCFNLLRWQLPWKTLPIRKYNRDLVYLKMLQFATLLGNSCPNMFRYVQ